MASNSTRTLTTQTHSGWTTRILVADLTRRVVSEVETPMSARRSLLGGSLLGARLMIDRALYDTAPCSPGNALLWLTGPLTGLSFPGAGRIHIMARSPLTGLVGEASMGGFFGVPLKLAGYDALIVTGRSREPAYIDIDGESHAVSIKDAGELWGRDSYATETLLRHRYKGRAVEVACIGLAGERQVPFAAIVHRYHNLAARTGMGAVMGSKNLKAVVVSAAGKREPADREAFRQLREAAIGTLREDYWSGRRKEFGTIGNLEWAIQTGRAPTRNWQNEGWQEEVKKITGETLARTYATGKRTCFACPIACKRLVRVDGPPYAIPEGPGPEYESAVALGALLLNSSLPGLLKANDICNRLGIDTITAGSTVAWALEAVGNGLLKDKWPMDISSQWGDPEAIVRLLELIGHREGEIGELLARGSAMAAHLVGHGSERFSVHVKGLELGFHHPRIARGMEISYATNPRGAAHTEAPTLPNMPNASYQDWAREIATSTDQSALPNSYVLCSFVCNALGHSFMAELLQAATGEAFDGAALARSAEVGWYLRRVFNLHCGAGRNADILPSRIIEQLDGVGLDHDDLDQAFQAYYEHRQIDERGFPSTEKLASLEIEDIPLPKKDDRGWSLPVWVSEPPSSKPG